MNDKQWPNRKVARKWGREEIDGSIASYLEREKTMISGAEEEDERDMKKTTAAHIPIRYASSPRDATKPR